MPTYKARAIILRSHKLGEADKIVRMYSRQGQVISAVARGSRKTGSKFRGRLELFNMADMELARGRNLDIVSQADIIHCFTDISRDFYKFAFAGIISNIVLKTQASGDDNPILFKLLYLSLNEIDNAARDDELVLKKILCVFEARFLQVTGLAPMLDSCSCCNKDPGELYAMQEKDVYFSIASGGVLCSRCARDTGTGIRMGVSAFRLLSDIFTLKIEDLRGVEPEPRNLKKVHRLLEDYLVYHTDCTIDSFRYLKKIGI